MKKRYLGVLLAAATLAACVVSAGCSMTESASAQVDLPVVKVMKLASVPSGVMASGKVLPDQEVLVVSKIPGKVVAVHVKEGSIVKQGDELVKLEDVDYLLQVKQAEAGIAASQAKLADARAGARAEEIEALEAAVKAAQTSVEQAKAAVEQAKAAYDLAQKTFERTRVLFESGAVPQAEMDRVTLEMVRAKSAYEQALAQQRSMASQLEAAQAKLDLARAGATANTLKALQADVDRQQAAKELALNQLANTSIKAPIGGMVVERNIDPGELAQPGVPLLKLVKMNPVQIQVSVPQEQINRVKKGDKVEVRVHGLGDKTFQGIVDFVSPVSDANNSTFPVKIKVENQEGLLRAGMLAEVRFMGESGKNSMEIPKSAVIEQEGKTYVFRVEDGVVKRTEVKLTPKNQDWYFVQEGLQGNERIVMNPGSGLQDGMQVKAE